MRRFAASITSLFGQSVVVLEDRQTTTRVCIARHGAALLSYEIELDGRTHDLADGYRDADEILARPGSRFAVMAPFAGRIADARYPFDGHLQDLRPGVNGVARASRHGFVRDAMFAVRALSADGVAARVVLGTSAIRPQPGYPHAIELDVHFSLGADGLTLEARMRNLGKTAAPCFFGWHPYFRVGNGSIDGWELQLAAQTMIRTDADLIPLPDNAAYVPLDDVPAMDFRQPRRIAGNVLDQGYTDLVVDGDGRHRSWLCDPAKGLRLAVWQERGVMHVFSADTLARDARRAVALEPMECMVDAFNRPDCAEAIRLAPGQQRQFRCGVEVARP